MKIGEIVDPKKAEIDYEYILTRREIIDESKCLDASFKEAEKYEKISFQGIKIFLM